jgi:hypothetical protein
MLRRAPRASLWLAFMACSAGCGGDDKGAPDAPVSTVSCSADPRLDAYSGELEKSGELDVLSFRFFDLDPAPPAKGSNIFHLEVSNAAGDVMQGGLRVDLRMPDHGHGTSVDPVVVFDAALGAYTIEPVYLFMPGVWRLDFEALDAPGDAPVTGDAVMLDSTTLHFCIEG